MKLLPIIILCAVTLAACNGNAGSISQVTSVPQSNIPVAQIATASATTAVTAMSVPATVENMSYLMTPTAPPRDINVPSGNAMESARATDTVLQPTPRHPLTFDESPVAITFDEFYDGYNMRAGLILSDKLTSLDGQTVVMEGYMAPPLKPELDYFVLTRIRLAFCPFCTNASDWPDDIALIYLPNQTTTATQAPVRITGRIEVGASVDYETGMVSLVRIYADTLEVMN